MRQNIEQKNRIIDDWNEQYPYLKRFSDNCLLMRMDILLIGLWFEIPSDPNSYSPRLIVKGLWGENYHKELLYDSLLWQSFSFRSHIKFNRHQDVFDEAARLSHLRYGFMFQPELKLSDMFSLIKLFYKIRHGHIWFYENAKLIKLMVALSTFFDNDATLANAIRRKTERDINKWNESNFLHDFNKSSKEWLNELHGISACRDSFIEQVQRNASRSRIESLNEGHIINDGQAAIDILNSPDYTIKDKVVDWLRYYHILAPERGSLY